MESLVAIMAMIAACSLEPGVYFSMNMKGVPAESVAKVTALGYDTSVVKMNDLAATIGEKDSFWARWPGRRRWPSTYGHLRFCRRFSRGGAGFVVSFCGHVLRRYSS